MTTPEIAVLVSSYQRPQHLSRVLHSIAAQQNVDGRFEVVVTDDGSEDETHDIVLDFSREQPFRVKLTTHPHETFQLARCRNEGARASTAPYLLFLDGDCLIPPDHLQRHLARKRKGIVYAGYCALLAEDVSREVDIAAVRSGRFMELAIASELKKLAKMDRKSRLYEFIRHPSKPKLFGGNVGIHRSDYELINGYDEAFEAGGVRTMICGFGYGKLAYVSSRYSVGRGPITYGIRRVRRPPMNGVREAMLSEFGVREFRLAANEV